MLRNAPAFNGYHESSTLTDTWKVERDGSVDAEVISPPMAETETLAEVFRVLSTGGLTVNARCGQHVHVSLKNASGQMMSIQQWRILAKAWLKWEHVFFSLTARSRRNGRQAGYCRQWNRTTAFARASSELMPSDTLAAEFQRVDQCNGVRDIVYIFCPERTMSLNLYRVIQGMPTMEFRLHHGTLNLRKAESWIRLLVAFVEAAQEGREVTADSADRNLEGLLAWCNPTGSGAAYRLTTVSRVVTEKPKRRTPPWSGSATRNQIFTLADNYCILNRLSYNDLRGAKAGAAADWIWNRLSMADSIGKMWGKITGTTPTGWTTASMTYHDKPEGAGPLVPQGRNTRKQILQVIAQWRTVRKADSVPASMPTPMPTGWEPDFVRYLQSRVAALA